MLVILAVCSCSVWTFDSTFFAPILVLAVRKEQLINCLKGYYEVIKLPNRIGGWTAEVCEKKARKVNAQHHRPGNWNAKPKCQASPSHSTYTSILHYGSSTHTLTQTHITGISSNPLPECQTFRKTCLSVHKISMITFLLSLSRVWPT